MAKERHEPVSVIQNFFNPVLQPINTWLTMVELGAQTLIDECNEIITKKPPQDDTWRKLSGENAKDYQKLDDPHQKYYDKLNVDQRKYLLLQVPDTRGTLVWFAADREQVLGEGTFGAVMKCFPVDAATGSIDLERPMAAKLIKNPEKMAQSLLQAEVDTLARYYKTYPISAHGTNQVIVTEYLPGNTLGNSDVLTKLNTLDFVERAELARSLMAGFNLIHHKTPSGSALAHVDIKPDNVIITFLEDKEGQLYADAAVIDFGLSTKLEGNTQSKVEGGVSGTLLTIPPESFRDGIYGTKSDVFSISSLMMTTFGAIDPYSDRLECDREDIDQYGFTAKGMLREIANIPPQLKKLTIGFVKTMGELEIEYRPSSDECLSFFSRAFHLAKFARDNKIDDVSFRKYLIALLPDTPNSEITKDPNMQKYVELLAKLHLLRHGFDGAIEFDGAHINYYECPFDPQLAASLVTQFTNNNVDFDRVADLLVNNAGLHDQAKLGEFNQYYREELKQESSSPRLFRQVSKHSFNSLNEVRKYAEQNPDGAVAKALEKFDHDSGFDSPRPQD